MNLPRLAFYTRRDCHLCEAARQVLERVRGRGAVFDLDIIDVDSDPALQALYGTEVPVLLVDAKKFAKVRFDERRLARKLGV
jgi:glutaredoxin